MAQTSFPTTRVHMWSGPRSMSTSIMYSFDSRADCTCFDEPLYAHHLKSNPHLQRPYRDELLAAHNPDGAAVCRDLLAGGACKTPLMMFKHMAKQAEGLDLEWAAQPPHVHVILIRDPVKLISSWAGPTSPNGLAMTLEEVGVAPLLALASKLRSAGAKVVVLDADDLAADPPAALNTLCDALGISFEASMLTWPAGPKACDGIWASHWYQSVHASSGWTSTNGRGPSRFPTECYGLLEEALPFYEALKQRALAIPAPSSDTSSSNQAQAVVQWPPSTMLAAGSPAATAMLPDSRCAELLVWVGSPGSGGRLLPRHQAKVSVFDSAVQGGDAAWEGLRVYDGRVFMLEKHLARLFASARALDFKNVHSKAEIERAIFATLAANGMRDNCHIRLTMSRGVKTTSSMNPNFNVFGCTLVVLAEWKPVESVATYDNAKGVSLVTASQRRHPPSCLDSKIHHNNLLNNILPKIQANLAGCADAIMLDMDGFVAETNACNLFAVSMEGVVLTPTADACLPGVTRGLVIKLVAEHPSLKDLKLEERRVSLSEFHSAAEVFTTGTMGELTPVVLIDGRPVGLGVPGPVTHAIRTAFRDLVADPANSTLLPEF